MSYFQKAAFIALGIQVDTVSDFVEDQTAYAVLGKPVTKIDHSVCFAPVFTIFPDFDGRTAKLM